jgi:hypothetical protein
LKRSSASTRCTKDDVKTLQSYAVTRESAIPSHWQHTVLPDASWHVMRDGRLESFDGGAALLLTPELRARLEAASTAETLIASDGATLWRLRSSAPAGMPLLWRAQSLSESRRRLFVDLRCRLSSRLSSQLLHELRNPMNALSLHADLLARLITTADGLERAANSVQLIRDRLKDLALRQNAMVALWLAPPAGADGGMLPRLENALRMVRAYGALHELRVRDNGLDALRHCKPPVVPAHAEVALVAWLLLACDLTLMAARAPRELLVEALPSPAGGLLVRLPLAIDDETPMPGTDAAVPQRIADFVGELALLLDDEPLTVRLDADGLSLQFDAA